MIEIASILVFLTGICMAAFPHFFWYLQHWLAVKGGEPTRFYLITTRILGVILALVAIFAFFDRP